MTEETTFIRPGYRRNKSHKPIDGVQFHSYSTGILRYARISEDGQIITVANGHGETYRAAVIGHGQILNATGKVMRFHSERNAKMQEKKA